MSCVFFIVSIDPVIRNIISSIEIKMMRLITPRSMEKIELKAGAYVDDVLVMCGADIESVNGIFRQYETMLFRLANRRLLVKCYDNKMV